MSKQPRSDFYEALEQINEDIDRAHAEEQTEFRRLNAAPIGSDTFIGSLAAYRALTVIHNAAVSRRLVFLDKYTPE